MNGILAIQIKQIGDCILTQPVFKSLKENYPGLKTGFLVKDTIAPLFENDPDIDVLLGYSFKTPFRSLLDMRKERFDAVFDFLSNPRSKIAVLFSGSGKRVGYRETRPRFMYNLALPKLPEPRYIVEIKLRLLEDAGYRTSFHLPEVYLSQEDRDFAREWARDNLAGGETLISVAPFSRRPARKWHAEGFLEVMRRVEYNLSGNVKFVICLGPGEREYAHPFIQRFSGRAVICPEAGLRKIAAVLEMTDAFIGCDNGLKHLAAAVGTPTLSIHLANQPVYWNPGGSEKHLYEWTGAGCRGCEKQICQDMICSAKTDIDSVEEKLMRLLDES